MFKINDNWSEE